MTDIRRGKSGRARVKAAGRSPRRPPNADLADQPDPNLEAQLDAGLEGTFPASDPVSLNSRSD
jgi:hypothetical protein